MKDNQLYFIAILLPKTVTDKITALKNSFATEYDCRHALKILPHITLQKPFMRSTASEVEMHLVLQRFFESLRPVEITLNGFGCFEKKGNKVIFLEVEENKLLREMYMQLMHLLRSELKFSEGETPSAFHPHITVGYRDLTAENFKKAWSAFQGRPWNENFISRNAYLLKHNFKQWEILSEFAFSKK